MEHDALAADGAIVRIRAVAPSDRPDLAALYRRTSDENLYRRFLCAGRGGIDHEVDRLTRPDGDDHVAVLAQERGRVVGVASYERMSDRRSAEFAVLVDDAAHGR
ncbi:MAG: GNAT family N-acetyltransferase, partial [Actinobacteria bacterium]